MTCHVARRVGKFMHRLRRDRREARHALMTTEAELVVYTRDHPGDFLDDAATDTTCRLLARLEDRDRRVLEEIDAAEERLANGTFGMCRDLCTADSVRAASCAAGGPSVRRVRSGGGTRNASRHGRSDARGGGPRSRPPGRRRARVRTVADDSRSRSSDRGSAERRARTESRAARRHGDADDGHVPPHDGRADAGHGCWWDGSNHDGPHARDARRDDEGDGRDHVEARQDDERGRGAEVGATCGLRAKLTA